MTSHEFHHHNHIITHTLNIETGKFRNLKVENNLSNTAAKVIVINYDSNITKQQLIIKISQTSILKTIRCI